jgi:hypothetical protein
MNSNGLDKSRAIIMSTVTAVAFVNRVGGLSTAEYIHRHLPKIIY